MRYRDKRTCHCDARRAVVSALVWPACGGGGGGGGNVRPIRRGCSKPPPPPPSRRWSMHPTRTYSQHLLSTNTAAAHQAGITGRAFASVCVDSGVMRSHPALSPRVVANLNLHLVRRPTTWPSTMSSATARRCRRSWPARRSVPGRAASRRVRRSCRRASLSDKPPKDDGSGSRQRSQWRAGAQGDPPGTDQPRRAGHEQLLGRPVLDQSGRDRGDRGRVPALRPEQRRAGGIRHRQRIEAGSVEHGGAAEPARARTAPCRRRTWSAAGSR